jgi:hypothetical protein
MREGGPTRRQEQTPRFQELIRADNNQKGHMEMTVEQEHSDDPTTYGAMLAIIRKRRWFFWGMVFVYIPASVTALQFTQSYKSLGLLFLIWLILLCIAVMLMACTKCPGCGNTFHMRNSTLYFSRKCSHCGLHIRGDVRKGEP